MHFPAHSPVDAVSLIVRIGALRTIAKNGSLWMLRIGAIRSCVPEFYIPRLAGLSWIQIPLLSYR